MKSFCEYFVIDSFSCLPWETPHTHMCGILTYQAGCIAQECPLLLLSVLRDQPQTQDVVTMLAMRNDLKYKTKFINIKFILQVYIPELVIVKIFFTITKKIYQLNNN